MKNRGKTVILVTHALHFLHEVDYIYTMVDGRIAEQGTFDTLMHNGGAFSRLIAEFGGDHDKKEDEDEEEQEPVTLAAVKKSTKGVGKAAGTGRIEGRLIVAEKRTIGALKMNGLWLRLRASAVAETPC